MHRAAFAPAAAFFDRAVPFSLITRGRTSRMQIGRLTGYLLNHDHDYRPRPLLGGGGGACVGQRGRVRDWPCPVGQHRASSSTMTSSGCPPPPPKSVGHSYQQTAERSFPESTLIRNERKPTSRHLNAPPPAALGARSSATHPRHGVLTACSVPLGPCEVAAAHSTLPFPRLRVRAAEPARPSPPGVPLPLPSLPWSDSNSAVGRGY